MSTVLENESLQKALSGESFANYPAIFEGFEAKGIPADQIKPRVNVFTFKAWKALGRVVKKGESGVKVATIIPCTKKDENLGIEVPVKKLKTTTVFHVSQTKPMGEGDEEGTDVAPQTSEATPEAATEAATEATQGEAVAMVNEAEANDSAAPNAYEERIEAKRERLLNAAAKASREAQTTRARAREMASVIPFGQPVLLDHYSAKRDLRYRDRIHSTFGKSFALQDKASHLERKAAAIGTGGISSDDPQAIQKLKAELAHVKTSQEQMKAANAILRRHKTPEARINALIALGYSEENAKKCIEPDFMGRIGFASYSLSNNNANARRIEARIKQLESLKQRDDVEIAGNGFTYKEDPEENRIMFLFPSKPAAEVREVLKRHAFKFSPSRNGAWVRKLNNGALWAAKEVREALASLSIETV
jgi:hypothetical protein